MRILYIDTSSSFLYTGIVENDKLKASCQKKLGHEMSTSALPEIAKMFETIKLDPKDIDKIIVVNGPGSFTGIRIGVTIAKVYAWSLNIPVTSITSLEAMATSTKANNYLIPVIDARRDYVFGAIYTKDYKEILKPKHIKIEDLLKELEKLDNYTIITNDEIEAFNNKKVEYNPDILKIVERYKDKENINPHALNPDYLKLTEAEEKVQNV